jgi:tetratricopeptide (TPR) repeat protein
MFYRVISFLLFLGIVATVAFNFKALLSYGRANEIERSAQKALAARNWEKGIALYEAGHKQYPDNVEISMRLAWWYLKNNQPAQAEVLYRGILRQEPEHLEARIGLANILKQQPQRVNEGITELRQALKRYPHNARLLATLGGVYKTAAENPQETRESVRKWLYTQARYYFQESLKLDAGQFQTQFNLGVAYQNLGDGAAAAKTYCKALQLRPDSYQSRYNLGLVLSELNFQDEAYRQLARSVQILSERNEMAAAQKLALQVQAVKNSIYNSNRRTLGEPGVPTFLEKSCLLQATTPSE